MSLDNFFLKSIFCGEFICFHVETMQKNERQTMLILTPRKDCAILPKVHIFRGCGVMADVRQKLMAGVEKGTGIL